MREFSLLGFIEHAAAISVAVVEAEQHALGHAAKIVQEEAKAAVGEYQPQSGPFQAWDPLAEATKADRVAKGFPEDEPELRTGAMRDSIQYTVLPHEAEIGSDSEVLEYQELGTARMPPRSILGGAAARKEREVVQVLGAELVAVLAGERAGVAIGAIGAGLLPKP